MAELKTGDQIPRFFTPYDLSKLYHLETSKQTILIAQNWNDVQERIRKETKPPNAGKEIALSIELAERLLHAYSLQWHLVSMSHSPLLPILFVGHDKNDKAAYSIDTACSVVLCDRKVDAADHVHLSGVSLSGNIKDSLGKDRVLGVTLGLDNKVQRVTISTISSGQSEYQFAPIVQPSHVPVTKRMLELTEHNHLVSFDQVLRSLDIDVRKKKKKLKIVMTLLS